MMVIGSYSSYLLRLGVRGKIFVFKDYGFLVIQRTKRASRRRKREDEISLT